MKAMHIVFKVPVDIEQIDGRFIASCFLLDTRHEGLTKHETLVALTGAVQSLLTSSCADRAIDAMLRRHDIRLPDAGDELETGHYIDVTVRLKITTPHPA